MKAHRIHLALAFVLAFAPAGIASASSHLAGTWSRLPAAPIAPNDVGLTSVWTGRELLVVARQTTTGTAGAVVGRVNVAAAYDPVTRRWRRLSSLPRSSSFATYSSAWTGREMLVFGQGVRVALNPTTNRVRRLPGSPLLSVHDGYGLVAWTGRELIGWGGGCCGDAFSDGVAYSPATNRWRPLAPSPLAGSQHPIGAWTGRELIVLVGGVDPDRKPWPARLARAAAYNPRTDTWRRIAPLPASRTDAKAVWTGRELLVVGGSARVGFAYNPARNRWRRLPAVDSPRIGAAAVWTGTRVLLWGGSTRGGLSYDPKTNRFSPLPRSPLRARRDAAAAWTGKSLIIWGGTHPRGLRDGALFTPERSTS